MTTYGLQAWIASAMCKILHKAITVKISILVDLVTPVVIVYLFTVQPNKLTMI